MARKKPHLGSSFESWLEDAGIREEVTAVAIKAVIARQLANEMKKIIFASVLILSEEKWLPR